MAGPGKLLAAVAGRLLSRFTKVAHTRLAQLPSPPARIEPLQ